MMKVEFYKHNLGDAEKRMVCECLDGIFLTTGQYVKDFESQFASYLGAKFAIGLNSCTAALHLSLLALGIGPGDEVITTPMTFIATVNAILHAGARPILVDVEARTGLIDPDRVEAAITSRTKAIIPIHLYGQMCDMLRIKKIADTHNLKIIEDCAHCVEGSRDGIRPGQLGDVACFSFYATKNVTCGEGGAATTNSEIIAERIRLLRQHGMTKEASERYQGNYKHWDMIDLGWKYNLSNIQGALLLPQLPRIEERWQRRKELYDLYIRAFSSMPYITIPLIYPNSKSAFHLFTVLVNRRDELLKYLNSVEVSCVVNYLAVHLLTFYKKKFSYKVGDYPNAEEIGSRTLSLPFWIGMESAHVEYVARAVSDFYNIESPVR